MRDAGRRHVIILVRVDQTPMVTEESGEIVRVIPGHRQSGALLWAAEAESADHGVRAGVGGGVEDMGVALLAVGRGEKVQNCPVVPNVELALWLPACDVPGDPPHLRASRAETGAGGVEGYWRQVQNGQLAVALVEQAVHQAAGAAADVNDRATGVVACVLQHP